MLRLIVFFVGFGSCIASATAQDIRLDRLDLGVRGGYEFDDVDRPSVGGELRVYLKERPYLLNPVVDVYRMRDRPSLWQADMNVLYVFNTDAGVLPYLGAGLAYTRIAGDGRSRSETGVNLIVGFFVEVTYVRIFLQGRSTLSNFDTVSAQAGVSFPFFRR
ncbi:MAG: hypothetical protein RhofKO_28270 [Rhodothermales bacterium]